MGKPRSEVKVGPRTPCSVCGNEPDVIAYGPSGGVCERCARWAVARFDLAKAEIEKFRADRDREEREG